MPLKVAILQSNYIPWKGYFDIIHDVDYFVFYETVQYTKNDWRNRNKIKTPQGTYWLTVPTGTDLGRQIYEVKIADAHWQKKHWKTIAQYYSKAPYFSRYQDFFKSVFLENKWETLSELNQFLIKSIARDFLGITTQFGDSREYIHVGDKQERLINLLKATDASTYVTGPAGKAYIDDAKFRAAKIDVVYKSYAGYPEYPQFHPPFDHFVSIVDLLFHVGPDSPYFIWGWRR